VLLLLNWKIPPPPSRGGYVYNSQCLGNNIYEEKRKKGEMIMNQEKVKNGKYKIKLNAKRGSVQVKKISLGG
jgi:hypothetical protein